MEDSNLTERHAILNAYYLPGKGTDGLYPSITPVNSFRLIFNAYFEGKYEMLEDRLFFTEKNGGYNLVEITDMVEWLNTNAQKSLRLFSHDNDSNYAWPEEKIAHNSIHWVVFLNTA